MAKSEVRVVKAPADTTLNKGFSPDVTRALDSITKSAKGVPRPRRRSPNGSYGTEYGHPPYLFEDADIATSQNVLTGPKLPEVSSPSDAPVQSLKAAKLTRRWGLRRCQVLP